MNRTIERDEVHLGGLRTALVLLIVIFIFSLIRYYPTPPKPVDSTPDVFSVERAMPILDALVGDGIPHPVGSEQNAVVRRRILDALESMGYFTEIQEATVQRREESYRIFNILARLEGTTPGKAVMLVSHYDSVPQGPGASDAGVCVAIILEIARILKTEPPPGNDIIFLITDAEEPGLLGARAFVDEHPWAADVAVAVNLEARGTSGPSLMFETSEQDAWLIELFARTVKRPFTTSLFVEVYKTMPNDTDFTIFKRYGIEGFNFAFIGSGWNYHTPQDNLENVTAASFQHEGDNALALIRSLSQLELDQNPAGKAVYFDLFSSLVIWWRQTWTIPMAVVCLLLLSAITIATHRRRLGRLKGAITAAALWLIVLIGAILGGIVFDRFLRLTGVTSQTWLRHPLILNLAIWLLALLWANVAVQQGSRRFGISSSWEMWCGLWMWFGAIGLLLAFMAPGASYLALAPTLVAVILGLGGLIADMRGLKISGTWVSVLSAAAIACLWIPHEFLFYDAFGFGSNVFLMGRAILVISCLTPLLVEAGQKGRRYISQGTAVLFIISTAMALVVQ